MANGTRRGEGSASRPGCSLPLEKTRYQLYRRLDGPQGLLGQVRKVSPPPGFHPRGRPARSQSLYRLSYPAHLPLSANEIFAFLGLTRRRWVVIYRRSGTTSPAYFQGSKIPRFSLNYLTFEDWTDSLCPKRR